jgi:uroporphyrinogen-III decarboxylase
MKYTTQEVKMKCRELVDTLGLGKFWLSTGGGMAPGTPLRNLDAMVDVVKEYV